MDTYRANSRAADPTPATHRGVVIAAVFAALAVGAWLATIGRMSGAEMGSTLTVGTFGFFIGLWVVMMAAMMFPSVWPAVVVFGLVTRRRVRRESGVGGRSLAFIGGYLVSWAAFGVVAFLLLDLARSSGLDGLSATDFARYVVAPVALTAAAYQAAPFKQACLRQCRGPLSFFLEHWRDGVQGAVAMGSRHGMFCVGCCSMLMIVLLAVGVMSLAWMAVVSLAIAVEKLTPARWSRYASGVLAAGLVALALVSVVEPSWLGLDGMTGMNDMDQMGDMGMTP